MCFFYNIIHDSHFYTIIFLILLFYVNVWHDLSQVIFEIIIYIITCLIKILDYYLFIV